MLAGKTRVLTASQPRVHRRLIVHCAQPIAQLCPAQQLLSRLPCRHSVVLRALPPRSQLQPGDGNEDDVGDFSEDVATDGVDGLDPSQVDEAGEEEYGEEDYEEYEEGADFDFDADSIELPPDDYEEGGEDVEDGEGQEQEEEVSALDAKYPRVPERIYTVPDLFSKAAYWDLAAMLKLDYPDVFVLDIETDAERLKEGDMFVSLSKDEEEIQKEVQRAVAAGAQALVLPDFVAKHPDVMMLIPDGYPVVFADNMVEASQRLAVAFFDAPARELQTIVVTGQLGKTTTCWLIRGMLEELDKVVGMVGSIEYAIAEDRLDIDGQLWEAKEADPTEGRECSAPFRMTPWAGKYHVPPTPPNGVVLQKVLAGMNDRGVGLLVLEVDAAAAARGTYDWVRPNVAVHTWLPAPPHGIAATAEAMQAYEALKDAALLPFRELEDVNTQLAIVNLDDPLSPELLELSKLVVSVTYAIDNTEADVVAESMKSDIWENEVIVRTPLGRLQIITPLLGKHNTYNILAAVATGIALELPLKSIVAGIEAVEVVPGRCEVIDEGQNFSVIVDRADNPKALEAMLTALKGSAENILTVVGCRGDEDSSQRPYMADTAHHLSDLVIFTNDSPRTEPPEAIVQDVVAGLPEAVVNRYSGYVYFPFQDQGHVPLWFEPYLQKAQRTTKRYVMEDRFSAIRAAIGSAGPGDVVLIAGRGHQDFMEYGTEEDTVVRAWFDDRAEARSALSKLAYLNQLTKLKRTHLPWGNALDEMDTLFDPPIDPDEEEQEEEKQTRKKPAAAAAASS